MSTPPTDLRLEWVASWEGAWPKIFASPDGEFLLSFVGDARFGGKPVEAPTAAVAPSRRGSRSFWFMRLGADGSVHSLVAAAGRFAWAEGIARLADGGLIAHGVSEGAASDDQLFRFGSDGSLRWARSLGKGVLGAANVNERASASR